MSNSPNPIWNYEIMLNRSGITQRGVKMVHVPISQLSSDAKRTIEDLNRFAARESIGGTSTH